MSRDLKNWSSAKNIARCAQFEALLTGRAMTVREVMAETGWTKDITKTLIYHLRDRVHVCGWVRAETGSFAGQWTWGAGVDVPFPVSKKPAKLKRAALQQRHPLLRQALTPQKVAIFPRKIVPARRDPTVAMFFGAAP